MNHLAYVARPWLRGLRGRLAQRGASGLGLRVRIAVQTQRDGLLVELAGIDRQLDALSAERSNVIRRLRQLRDQLWPVIPHGTGRRPPAVDGPVMPPLPVGAPLLSGRDLRAVAVTLLRRHDELSLLDLHALLHRYGYGVAGANPAKVLADAMRYEVSSGRLARVAHGVYAALPQPPRRGRRSYGPNGSPDPTLGLALPDEPLEWAESPDDGDAGAGGWQPVDPDLRAEPARWTDPGPWHGDRGAGPDAAAAEPEGGSAEPARDAPAGPDAARGPVPTEDPRPGLPAAPEPPPPEDPPPPAEPPDT